MQKIESEGKVLAIIVRAEDRKPGCNFVSPEEFPLQLGIQSRPKGEVIDAHEHVPFQDIEQMDSQEFFYVESGKVHIKILDKNQEKETITLSDKDMILLNCGHEIAFEEDTTFIELKQGPYRGKENEKRFISK